MHEIICPHCNTAFKVDEAGYADILKQVRDRDFEQQLNKRLALAEQEKRNAIELAVAKKIVKCRCWKHNSSKVPCIRNWRLKMP